MSNPIEPVPQRIGDAERDRAAEFLREHLAQGRLDQAEFDERLNTALGARYRTELDPLFTDLPAPNPRHPGTGLAPTAANAAQPVAQHPPGMPLRTRNTIDAVFWIIWPVTIGLITWLDWGNFWWLIFLPIALSSIWQRKKALDAADRKRWEKEQRRAVEGDNEVDHGPDRGEPGDGPQPPTR
ncbi:DUF1707 SHOCT-like domain-containing protein [Microlunatus elymi]|uniref:DUF1707 SHOCT-like domain-containing protein n=1 Tax=Microlunatus elymi TaxID=2596828 RepID=UPI001AEF7995|nr:DUF1707 domain-containing protein [Microlunatus elymi]